MAFLSIDNFLNHKITFLKGTISSCEEKKYRYSTYKIFLDKQYLEYKSIEKNLLNKGDSLLCFTRKNKIILFKNLSTKKDNFKEARLRFSLLLLICLCAFLSFLFLYFYNRFMIIDLFFLSIFSVFFVLSLCTNISIYKQIKMLKSI